MEHDPAQKLITLQFGPTSADDSIPFVLSNERELQQFKISQLLHSAIQIAINRTELHGDLA